MVFLSYSLFYLIVYSQIRYKFSCIFRIKDVLFVFYHMYNKDSCIFVVFSLDKKHESPDFHLLDPKKMKIRRLFYGEMS